MHDLQLLEFYNTASTLDEKFFKRIILCLSNDCDVKKKTILFPLNHLQIYIVDYKS